MVDLVLMQVLIIVFSFFALSRAFLRWRKDSIAVKEFLLWTVLWVTIIAGTLLPRAVTDIANFLGIGRPVDAVIYVSIILLFYLAFRLYVNIDALSGELTAVVREVALINNNTTNNNNKTNKKN